MKKLLIISFLFLSFFTFSQNKTATTEDGKKVVLNNDGTWKYIDAKNNCQPDKNFIEPVDEKKHLSFLKKTGATITDLKEQIAVDFGCPMEKIVIISMASEMSSGVYNVCVCGEMVKFRRTGTVFSKD